MIERACASGSGMYILFSKRRLIAGSSSHGTLVAPSTSMPSCVLLTPCCCVHKHVEINTGECVNSMKRSASVCNVDGALTSTNAAKKCTLAYTIHSAATYCYCCIDALVRLCIADIQHCRITALGTSDTVCCTMQLSAS
jgi:hypothetical protein